MDSVAGSLQYTDANINYSTTIGTPAGNMSELSNQRGKSDRMSTTGLPSGSGTLYYSLLLKVNDFTGFTGTAGAFVAGFNNSAGNATTAVTQAGARLQIRRDPTDTTKYNLGIRNDVTASTGTSTLDWDEAQYSLGTTLFVVASYEFNLSSVTDDVARLWINPSSTDLGAAVAPTATASSTGGDINQQQIQSFFLRQVSGTLTPRALQIDEIRLDTTWAGVTSVPEPASVGTLALVTAAAALKRRRR